MERRFKIGLSNTGALNAAEVRKLVSNSVRETTAQPKPEIVEPLDYENLMVKNKTLLLNDPHRELLFFPPDDLSQSTLPRRFRTQQCSIPSSEVKNVTSLLARKAIHSYTSNWSLVHYKYNAYGDSYSTLPFAERSEILQHHLFEVDIEAEGRDSNASRNNVQFTKQGWLYRGPKSDSETSMISFTKSFKKRYTYLRQQADRTYVLEFYKDERKLETAKSVFLDSAVLVEKNSKKGKYAFEIGFSDTVSLFACDNDADLDAWVQALKSVISPNVASANGVDRHSKDSDSFSCKSDSFRHSLEFSMNPELQKYALETEAMLATQRKQGRRLLFSTYPEIQVFLPRSNKMVKDLVEKPTDEYNDEVYKEQFGTRFILQCDEFRLRLQMETSDGTGVQLLNPEPVFIKFAVYHAKHGKLSEDFVWDPNCPQIKAMIPADLMSAHDYLGKSDSDELKAPHLVVSPSVLTNSNLAVFSITKPDPDVYLVVHIEKVLQGSIATATEPYTKTPDLRFGIKIHRNMQSYCSRLGHYRMPFAWGARPVFCKNNKLDTISDFSFYRQENMRLGDDELLKRLQDLKKPDRQSRWVNVLASLSYSLFEFKSTLQNTVTTSLQPVKPYHNTETQQAVREVYEFSPDDEQIAFPYVSYLHHLYVYPKQLKFDSQKTFPKARNIACWVELRESDQSGAIPLKRIYSSGSSTFTAAACAAVIHHSTIPEFYEEVKVALPAQLHEKHHLVFTFYHVSCEPGKTNNIKKMQSIETNVGYAWISLLSQGRINNGEQCLRVSSNLPPGYLSLEANRMTTDIRWVDGGKPIFKISLSLTSTTYTKDQHLHNFFQHCQILEASNQTNGKAKGTEDTETSTAISSPFDREMLKLVKSLHAVEKCTLIRFLPTLLSQLLEVLITVTSDDVACNAAIVLIHIVSEVHECKKQDVLNAFVKYVFMANDTSTQSDRTIHEELAKQLKTILLPTQANFLIVGRFLKHAGFFFELLAKSMAQHLLITERIKMSRNERFPASFQFHIKMLVQTLISHIKQKVKEAPEDSHVANQSLAIFIKKCMSLMDRSFAFRLINIYIDTFLPDNPKILADFKFEFLRVVCSHEHFIPLNLPMMQKQAKNYKDLKHSYNLSDEFRRSHFLVGLLLQELKLAMSLNKDVRKPAIYTLRNLLAKHSFDDRYASKGHQSRIAVLYLPLISIILENRPRLVSSASGMGTAGTTTPGHSSSMITLQNGNDDLPTPTRNTAGFSESIGGPPTACDPAVFAMIAGQTAGLGSLQTDVSGGSMTSLESGQSTANSACSTIPAATEVNGRPTANHLSLKLDTDSSMMGSASLSASNAGGGVLRCDRLDQQEIRDLLVSFLYVVKNLTDDILLGWLSSSAEYEVLDFLSVLELCMKQFKYVGKKRITSLCIISDSKRALTLPAGKKNALQNYIQMRANSMHAENLDIMAGVPENESDAVYRAAMEANLSAEVSLTVLDIVCLYTQSFQNHLQLNYGDNAIMRRIFALHLLFLETNQSEAVLLQVFATLRSFVSKFETVLFKGEAELCSSLIYSVLRCCNSLLENTRSEACALIYLLMRRNFEFSKRRNFNRTHLQMIICVSQLLGDVSGLSSSRFTESLSIINNYATSDVAMQRTVFPVEVKDLTKRIRTVLMATAQMKDHLNDPEKLIDLQYSLAKSYTATPELRKTWLESMTRIHRKNGNLSEATQCVVHIAALIAEYLRRKGKLSKVFPQGCSAFKSISSNVEAEESGMRNDIGMQDVHYTEAHLTDSLEECCRLAEESERYELLGDLYRLITPIYERNRNFGKLASAYERLHLAYSRVVEVMNSGRRLLGKYFRVAFYGEVYFEDEHGKQYVYKEPKITGLTEICERLKHMYQCKFGQDNVLLIMDSAKVDVAALDTQLAYIQVTYVTPYFDEKELMERTTYFERNHNVRRFVFSTPFTKSGKARGEIADQWKRLTIVTTSHAFPYVKKRIPIIFEKVEELEPIDVAFEAMQERTVELLEVIKTRDLKRLQLKVQGCVSVQVNAGPLAYAQVFLDQSVVHKHADEKVNRLREVFQEFVLVCDKALELNARLISSDQADYQESLYANFMEMTQQLSMIFGETLISRGRRHSNSSHASSFTHLSVASASGTSIV